MENIKTYRENELKKYVIANIIVIFFITGTISFEGIINNNSYMKLLITGINSTLFSSVIYSLVTVGDCVISNKLKRYFVFWWFPMPGETIFSEIKMGINDGRFTSYEAKKIYKKIYKKLPKDKKKCYEYENSKWYGLLQKYENEMKVMVTNRDYLMCRDMTSSTILMIIVYFAISFVLKLIAFKMKALLYLCFMYFLCKFATIGKSKRLVNTVIACDIHNSKKKGESKK